MLPTGTKSVMQFASITLGAVSAQAGRNDVGGDKRGTEHRNRDPWGRGDDGRTNWDGMNANSPYGNGGGQYRTYFYNTVGVQEVSVDTGGNSAESENGGRQHQHGAEGRWEYLQVLRRCKLHVEQVLGKERVG